MSTPEWTDLRDIEASRWLTVPLKGTSTDVGLVVLHHDDSGAAVSLVRFPPGLARTEAGCYPSAEELAIVDGSLDFAGHVFVPGDYCHVPVRVLRPPMTSPDGLLVLAWFSGPPTWLTDESERRAGEVTRRALVPGVLREPSADVPGRTEVVARFAEVDDAAGRDIYDVEGGRWVFVPAGEPAPSCDGPAQVRHWPTS